MGYSLVYSIFSTHDRCLILVLNLIARSWKCRIGCMGLADLMFFSLESQI